MNSLQTRSQIGVLGRRLWNELDPFCLVRPFALFGQKPAKLVCSAIRAEGVGKGKIEPFVRVKAL